MELRFINTLNASERNLGKQKAVKILKERLSGINRGPAFSVEEQKTVLNLAIAGLKQEIEQKEWNQRKEEKDIKAEERQRIEARLKEIADADKKNKEFLGLAQAIAADKSPEKENGKKSDAEVVREKSALLKEQREQDEKTLNSLKEKSGSFWWKIGWLGKKDKAFIRAVLNKMGYQGNY